MVRDPELFEHARGLIAQDLASAEWAVHRSLERMRATFAGLEDSYFRERGRDVEHVGDRVMRNLLGLPEPRGGDGDPAGAIAVGVDLSPLDVLQLHRAGVVGFVTESGGRTSHAAIIARSLGVPYVAGVEGLMVTLRPGDLLVIDGRRGEVITGAAGETVALVRTERRRRRAREYKVRAARSLAATTRDGVEINVGANVQRLADIPAALDAGASCVGLFRTELLYLERQSLPSEEEQLHDAVEALKALGGRPATFRTLDVGAGKLPAGVRLPDEPNPALGVRSIRFSLRAPSLFRAQLRALYRASAHGPLRIMFPLVASVTELGQVLAFCADVRAELAREGHAFDPRVPLGIMVETPSAALTADHLAHHVDFLSIGTNDLIQYTFAADRDNDEVAYLYHPLHPAVLRLLRAVIAAGRATGKPVSLCGDMASDPAATWVLLGLGLRELSMAGRYIPAVKAVVRGAHIAEAEALAARALEVESELEAEALVQRTMHARFPADIPELTQSRAGAD
jgi:phosphotransferase system enzyme I (PtsI)